MPKPNFSNTQKIQEIIRVDHAGEYGARRIYQGQLAFTKKNQDKLIIKEMLGQELEHLEYFENEIKTSKSIRHRPTFLIPIWHVGGYVLGAIGALAGAKGSMTVTEGVEEVIVGHYQEQIDYLKQNDPENPLLPKIQKFQADEAEHIHIAKDYNGRPAFIDNLLKKFVKGICKTAIFLSKKV